jgi:hypothetical protein
MVRFFLAASVAAFGTLCAPWAPHANAYAVHAGCGAWNASSGSCYFSNCTAAHNAGYGDISSSDPYYCSKQDRDGDGLACEW